MLSHCVPLIPLVGPVTGSDNTPTVSLSFQEASTVNTVVVDLLRLQSIHNQDAALLSSVFYYPPSPQYYGL